MSIFLVHLKTYNQDEHEMEIYEIKDFIIHPQDLMLLELMGLV